MTVRSTNERSLGNPPATPLHSDMASRCLPKSLVGPLHLTATERGLSRLHFGEGPDEAGAGVDHLAQAFEELQGYFRGELKRFTVPLDLQGTPFQLAVWGQLRDIPFGETRTYGELARRLGDAGAMRAVGTANHQNPVAIIVPCHRVVAAGGKLGGFGGGLARKRALLAHEQQHRPFVLAP